MDDAMGAICHLRQLPQRAAEHLIAHVDEVYPLIYALNPNPDDPDEISTAKAIIESLYDDPTEHIDIELDKLWDGVNFMLTGKYCGGTEPWCFLTEGGATVGGDEEYPTRILDAIQVAAFNEAIRGLSRLKLATKLQQDSFYGQFDTKWYVDKFDELAAFVRGVANRNNCILVYYD